MGSRNFRILGLLAVIVFWLQTRSLAGYDCADLLKGGVFDVLSQHHQHTLHEKYLDFLRTATFEEVDKAQNAGLSVAFGDLPIGGTWTKDSWEKSASQRLSLQEKDVTETDVMDLFVRSADPIIIDGYLKCMQAESPLKWSFKEVGDDILLTIEWHLEKEPIKFRPPTILRATIDPKTPFPTEIAANSSVEVTLHRTECGSVIVVANHDQLVKPLEIVIRGHCPPPPASYVWIVIDKLDVKHLHNNGQRLLHVGLSAQFDNQQPEALQFSKFYLASDAQLGEVPIHQSFRVRKPDDKEWHHFTVKFALFCSSPNAQGNLDNFYNAGQLDLPVGNLKEGANSQPIDVNTVNTENPDVVTQTIVTCHMEY